MSRIIRVFPERTSYTPADVKTLSEEIREIRLRLEDLAKDRESFFRADGDDGIFRDDYAALKRASALLVSLHSELAQTQKERDEALRWVIDKCANCANNTTCNHEKAEGWQRNYKTCEDWQWRGAVDGEDVNGLEAT